MSTVTAESASLRAVIAAGRYVLDNVLSRYGAINPRLFGSVARGDATSDSDIDLLVDLLPGSGNELLRVAAIAEELTELLGCASTSWPHRCFVVRFPRVLWLTRWRCEQV